MIINNTISFVGVGVPRCGTTWLAFCLKEHPEVFIPSIKELYYFNQPMHSAKGIEWYRKYFKDAPENTALGEFTTDYYQYPHVADALLALNKDVKILICVRDPVERAFSHYLYIKRLGSLRDDFGTVIRDPLHEFRQITDCGFYNKYIPKFLNKFSAENIKLIVLEDMQSDPGQTVRDVYKFLDVDPEFHATNLDRELNRSKNLQYKIQFLQRWHMKKIRFRKFRSWDFITNVAQYTGFLKLWSGVENWNQIYSDSESESMTKADRDYLQELYKDDVTAFKQYLNQPISSWSNFQ